LHGGIYAASPGTDQQQDKRQKDWQAEGNMGHARSLHGFIGFFAVGRRE
jgi:hypothetical protein